MKTKDIIVINIKKHNSLREQFDKKKEEYKSRLYLHKRTKAGRL